MAKAKKMLFERFNVLKDQVFRLIDNQGKLINSELMPTITKEVTLNAYRKMCLSRMLDKWMDKYQRQGRLLSFLSSTGQEACEVAYSMQLIPKVDWFSGAYRNVSAWITSGASIKSILLCFGGNENGNITPLDSRILPANVVIGTQYSVASGIAYGQKLKKDKGIVVTTIGDGGTSEGEFYEAMNFAKVHELPVVFIIENNHYAISTPTKLATKSINLAVKAIAAGIPSIKVDGNDFFACYRAVEEVYEFVRAGKGPFCIEFDTYRLGPHSSSDDPKIYLPKGELDKQKAICPITRMKKYLISKKWWSEEKQAVLDDEQKTFVKEQFKLYEKDNIVTVEDVFKHTYEKMYPELQRQLDEAKKFHG